MRVVEPRWAGRNFVFVAAVPGGAAIGAVMAAVRRGELILGAAVGGAGGLIVAMGIIGFLLIAIARTGRVAIGHPEAVVLYSPRAGATTDAVRTLGRGDTVVLPEAFVFVFEDDRMLIYAARKDPHLLQEVAAADIRDISRGALETPWAWLSAWTSHDASRPGIVVTVNSEGRESVLSFSPLGSSGNYLNGSRCSVLSRHLHRAMIGPLPESTRSSSRPDVPN